MAPTLIGPPEPKPKPPPPTLATSDPFLATLLTNFNNDHPFDPFDPSNPHLGLTSNLAPTLIETTNPCLDLFFEIVPSTPSHTLTSKLTEAWDHDSLTTLKLICNLRGVRGTGKSDKSGFYNAAIWLHSHHPKTLACNLINFAKFGYFKDFPEMLFRILGLDHTEKMRPSRGGRRRGPFVVKRKGEGKKRVKTGKKSVAKKEFKIREARDKQVMEKEKASDLRRKKKADLAKNAIKRYNHDPDFRFLHERVSDLFSGILKEDMVALKSGEFRKISLASKWCPSLDSALDRATLLCEVIARKMFPREGSVEYESVEEAHYAYRVRDRLRKDLLVPLRKALELPEIYMGGGRWDELPYNRVASVAMKNYKDHFLKHDEKRFNEYLELVKEGKAKIAAGALLPHEIVGEVLKGGEDGGQVAELQWKRMVEDLLKEGKDGKLGNCIGICDVSSSMEGVPLEVCVSLGILLSELSEQPWKGKVITFSENPELHLIEGDDLYSKAQFIRKMKWGENTNLQRVFELILYIAVQAKLKPEQMIKKLFVFSDMEFEKASHVATFGKASAAEWGMRIPVASRVGRHSDWETDYMAIVRKYEEAGFKEAIPEIVFWNLKDSRSIPVTKKQKGVALVSGFSKNAMKMFLQGKQGDPQAVMDDALSRKEYADLVVID